MKRRDPQTPRHDMGLFGRLRAAAERLSPDLRVGTMFGCPALYRGQRLVMCVFGTVVGIKVPVAVAAPAIATGRAVPFRPYGKPAMKEWLQIKALEGNEDLLRAAIDFAEKKFPE